MSSIGRLLIANRGEIAVRIARTAHRLGIETIGVYSEADALALHVDSVDLAVSLGGATPAESYLAADKVIAAATRTGCDAVHPGYGFLAESAEFARSVTAAGLTWVGPTADQIALLGDKIAAKRAATAAGVPTSGFHEIRPGTIPPGIGMPALVKAAAGGGGRGMRVVRTAGELAEAVEAASREASSAFGDGTVFIEPYIENGRHIEVQIIGDTFGGLVHLGERECSIQRRNQKIIEEAPSAGIDDQVRRRLLDGALSLGRHVGYVNAGTVEFLVGANGQATFLEVNTRLQVEHPVTEAVTGLDMVELQLLVAAGEPLPIAQGDVVVHGHAIEARVVAEDPASGWLPSAGRIELFEVGDGSVRVDRGVRTGSLVSGDYDSLLAKVVAHAGDRGTAARRLARALRSTHVAGVRTNIDTCTAILGSAHFLEAATPTSFLADHPELSDGSRSPGSRPELVLAAVLALELHNRRSDPATPFAPSGWRNLRTRGQRRIVMDAETEHRVEYTFTGSDSLTVEIGAWPEPTADGSLEPDERDTLAVRLLRRTEAELVIEIDGVRHVVRTEVHGVGPDGERRVLVRSKHGAASLSFPPAFDEHHTVAAGAGPICPLPGTVLTVAVQPGQTVSEGDLLMVIEAMKMEHRMCAATDGVVAAVHFSAGDRVDAGDLLVDLDHGAE